MGMFTDLHKLDQDQEKNPATAEQTGRPTAPLAIVTPDHLRPQGADSPAVATSEAARAALPTGTEPSLTPPYSEPPFDLGEMPYRKFTCLLTPAEQRALDLLKIELSDTLDGAITKEQLARCAIHYLVEDVKRHGEHSPVIVPLRKKVGSR